ncbi:hypothetical protein [Bifidobacterium sp. 7101]|uniref:hypothetical protein n=1 Tax=Bifidobacterium sp. 7101 TaxID=1394175 RepID=UPI0012DE1603|nr:hypothetical protein [Bifidobacterium sp. 7101]
MISLLTGLAIGLVFGMPVGVAGIMGMQRTLSAGPADGFITGMGQPWQRACMVLSDFLAPACFLRLFSVNKSQLYLREPYWLRQSASSDFTTSLSQKGLPNELIAKNDVRPAGDEITSRSCEQLVYSQSQLFMIPYICNRYNLISFAFGLAAGVTNPVSMLGLSLSRSVLNADWNQHSFGCMDHNWHIYRDDDLAVPLNCHGGGIAKEDTATHRNLVRFG